MLGRDVAIGQLYLALSKLVDQQLISFRHTKPEPVRGGRSKKIFQLEALGAKVLGNAAAELSA
jgi:DNA-binding PadR family transcriptional regulator